jgi:replicative DNA helicase
MSSNFTGFGYLGKSYQVNLLMNIIWDSNFAKVVIPKLSAGLFDNLTSKQLFNLIKEYYETHGLTPNIDNVDQMIKLEVNDEIQREQLLSETGAIMRARRAIERGERESDAAYIQQTTFDFIRQQLVRKVLLQAQEKLDAGQLASADELPDLFREALLVGKAEDNGVNIFEFDDSLLENQYVDAIKMGLGPIDRITGGLPKGKLGMILAGQGIGKTSLLNYIADTAFLDGKNVLQIIFDENSVEEVMKAHYAKWSEIPAVEFVNNKEKVKERVMEIKQKHRAGKLIIKRFSSDGTTIPMIKAWIKAYQEMYAVNFDLLVVDYIDEIESTKNLSVWDAQADVAKTLHSMLVDFNIPGWTATQAKKDSNDKRLLVFDDCGGSVAKLKKAQLIISIGADLDQKRKNQANFTILKSNFSSCGQIYEDCTFNRGILKVDITESHDYLPGDIIGQGFDPDDVIPPRFDARAGLPTSNFEDDTQNPTQSAGTLDDTISGLTL